MAGKEDYSMEETEDSESASESLNYNLRSVKPAGHHNSSPSNPGNSDVPGYLISLMTGNAASANIKRNLERKQKVNNFFLWDFRASFWAFSIYFSFITRLGIRSWPKLPCIVLAELTIANAWAGDNPMKIVTEKSKLTTRLIPRMSVETLHANIH